MNFRSLALMTFLLSGSACGDNEPARLADCSGPDAAVTLDAAPDAAVTSDAAVTPVSSGPCYADPRTTLRFADWAPVTQSDGVDCYAVYTVTTSGTELFCPCPDRTACDAALTALTAEAGACPSK